jgi:hypothetical protein
MLFYVIPPLTNLSLAEKGTAGYYCLAHLYYKHAHYRKFFKKKKEEGYFITLDNGAAESSLVTPKVLLNIVTDLMPDEVIAPDVLFDKDATIKNLNKFIHAMKKENLLEKVNIFGCPQGRSQKEWLDSYKTMLNNKNVKVIGLSKISVPYCWYNQATNDTHIAEARQKCVKYLFVNNLITKPLHLLGMGDYREYLDYKKYNCKLIRSTDSCYTVLAALKNIRFKEEEFKRIKTTNDYFTSKLTKKQREIALYNINQLNKIVEEVN